jgi:hypothetical protein
MGKKTVYLDKDYGEIVAFYVVHNSELWSIKYDGYKDFSEQLNLWKNVSTKPVIRCFKTLEEAKENYDNYIKETGFNIKNY